MNRTKKIIIGFVLVCLLVIGGIGTYRSIRPSDVTTAGDTVEVDTIKKKEKSPEEDSSALDEENTQDTKKTTEEKKDTKTTDTKKETADTKEKSTKKTESTSKKKTDTSSTKKEEVTSTVTVKITGYQDEKIASGSITFTGEKETVYAVTKSFCNEKGISLGKTGSDTSVYICSINGLAEKEHGGSSGWMYKVNGTPPNCGCGSISVKDGDSIEWYYVYSE